MSTTRTKSHIRRELPTEFGALVVELPPRAIIDETDYDNMIEMMNWLTSVAEPTEGQLAYRQTLSILIQHYEAERHAIDTSDITPLDLLNHLLDEAGMNSADLGRLLGNNPSLGSKILRGERELSKTHIRKLAQHFHVDPGTFL